jgi:hypothetical protein
VLRIIYNESLTSAKENEDILLALRMQKEWKKSLRVVLIDMKMFCFSLWIMTSYKEHFL